MRRALIEPIYTRASEAVQAYQFKKATFFGSEMLVVPITSPRAATTGLAAVCGYVPAGLWTDFLLQQITTGPAVEQFHRNSVHYPVLDCSGGIIPLAVAPMAPVALYSGAKPIKLFPGARNCYVLREQTASGMAQTKLLWDPKTCILQLMLADPANIIPTARVYQLVPIG